MATHTRAITRVDEETGAGCGGAFKRLFGEVLVDGHPRGMYSADLHREGGRPTAILAIAMGLPTDDGTLMQLGVTCNLWLNDSGEFPARPSRFPAGIALLRIRDPWHTALA